ncbi:MAG: hypothetical protein RLN69_14130 [Woeseiaceae bacterium]
MESTSERINEGTGSSVTDEATVSRLREELEAAATAAFMQLRMIAATASVEARLSIVSAMSIATARSLSVAFLVVGWLCLLSLAGLVLINAGNSPEFTLLIMAAVNGAIAAGLHRWQKWLAGNIGLPRTRKLLRQIPGAEVREKT